MKNPLLAFKSRRSKILLVIACLTFLALFAILLAVLAVVGEFVSMPGKSFRGTPPALTDDERSSMDYMKAHVEKLAGEIGERNISKAYPQLQQTADYIESELKALGYTTWRECYEVDGKEVCNINAEITVLRALGVLLIGAHYDTVPGSPGADDNTSAVAMNLALARDVLKLLPSNRSGIQRSIRFAFYVNEERPYAHTPNMGSYVSAANSKEKGENIEQITLEMVGYFTDEPVQRYPLEQLSYLYPERGNFIAFVSYTNSGELVRQALEAFREHATIPSEGLIAPPNLKDIGRSDHWSYLQHGYPAIMVTDTSEFRNTLYHTPKDTPDTLNYEAMARVESGLARAIIDLARRQP